MNSTELDQSLAIIEVCRDLLEHKKRDTKLLFIALMCSVLVNVLIVCAFLWYESTWEFTDTVTTTTEQSVEGDDSDIVNGDQYNNKGD